MCCKGLSNSSSVSAYGSSDCGGDADGDGDGDGDDDNDDDDDDNGGNAGNDDSDDSDGGNDDDDDDDADSNITLSCLLMFGISKLTFSGDFLDAILDFVGVPILLRCCGTLSWYF
jgi:hypothetical protein